ncbi:MAG: DUF2079 domain-containing protein [Thermoplasmata archaeon]|nr:DUF2079 domain-containing protein [Thermoplasmata archaeon]
MARLRRLPQIELLALATLVAAVVIFSVWWTELSWTRYLAFHLAVYDVGVDYQIIWAAAHGYSINEAGPGTTHLLLYAFLIPYWLIPSQSGFFLFLIAFEAVWLALGVFPIYWIAKDQVHRPWVGVAFGLAYLAYPALSGPLWFPVHYEALFPTLFLFGYWAYRRGHLRWAAGFWVLSLFTDAGATLVIGALGLGMVLEPSVGRTGLWDRLRGRPRPARAPFPRERVLLGVFLLAAGLALFFGIALTYGFLQFLFFTTRTSFASGSTISRALPFNPFNNWPNKMATIVLMFGPLLALPLWAREERWAIVPYLGPALLTTSFAGFLFPFNNQYPCFVIPVLFVAALRGLERPWGIRARTPTVTPRPTRRRYGWARPNDRSIAVGVLVVTLVCSSVFAAWGPFNPQLRENRTLGGGYYNVPYEVDSNQSAARDLQQMINMVPGTGWVLVQNNLPQLLNRTTWTIPGYYTVGQPLDYLINDPYDYNFYALNTFGAVPGSMVNWSNYFLAQGWHVVADADGALLLSANGTGAPAFYVPLVQTFYPSDFLGVGPSRPAHQIFDGPKLPIDGAYSTFAPGIYTITLTLRVDHPLPTDRLYFGIGFNYSRSLIENNSIVGAPWTGVNGTVSLSYTLFLAQYYPGMAFTLYEIQWSGALSLVSIRLAQTAPAEGNTGA